MSYLHYLHLAINKSSITLSEHPKARVKARIWLDLRTGKLAGKIRCMELTNEQIMQILRKVFPAVHFCISQEGEIAWLG